jgi:universal stress protein E
MTASNIRSILVAVAAPGEPQNKAVRRAAEIARGTGASLELFHTASSPFGVAPGLSSGEAEELGKEIIAERQGQLERMANRLRREELVVTTTVAWDYPPHESIVRHALKSKCDLVVIEAHKHNRLARLLLAQTDFELIRLCHVPLLIVKGHRVWRRPVILAALDPFHRHDKPADLDARIVAVAGDFANACNGVVHGAHIYPPLLNFTPGTMVEPVAIPAPAAEQRRYQTEMRRRFAASASALGIAANKVHLRSGDPGLELPRLVKSLGAQVVVMGAVSRSAWKNLFIGHTAERVLDSLSCDALVVKPGNYRPTVPARRPQPLPMMPTW